MLLPETDGGQYADILFINVSIFLLTGAMP